MSPSRVSVLAVLLGLSTSIGVEAAAPAGEWWNASYLYRRKLDVTAGAVALPTQYSTRIQVDHAALVFAGQSLASGNDARIAYWNGTGWVELDRMLDDQSAWNNAASQIWFRTQAPIGASSTDDNYYLYYGNPSAGAPPANWANVFLFHDDFNGGALDGTRWACTLGTCTQAAGTLTLDADSKARAAAAYAFGADTRWECFGRLGSNFSPGFGQTLDYCGASDTNDWTNDFIRLNATNFSHQYFTQLAGVAAGGTFANGAATSNHLYAIDREGVAGVRFHRDGAQVGNQNNVTAIPSSNLRMFIWNNSTLASGIILDWVRVRHYVTSEPTLNASPTELGPGQMRVLSGTYVGNGVDDRSIFVPFQPDVVFVDRNDPSNPPIDDEAVLRTSTMPAGTSKFIDGGAGIPLAANGIKSLDPSGFTVGTHNNVNQNGITYYWVAFQAAPGQLEVGTYLGANSAQDITSVGFAPAYLISTSEGAHKAVQKSSPMPANFSQDFTALGYTDAILNFRPDGFRVGTNSIANNNGTVYHYVAWGNVPGRVAVGSYAGGVPADNRDINGTGFFPEWIIVNRSSGAAGSQGNSPAHKPASSGVSADLAPLFDGAIAETNNIQRLQADGFQVGGHQRVNTSSAPSTYHWIAFGPHTPGINYRSIGPAANESTGTLTATNGSPDLSGAGTLWQTRNRGRGDVITICDNPPACSTNVDYVVLSVASDTTLTLTTPYTGTSGGGKTFTLKRQFTIPRDWVDCVNGPPNTYTGCPYFPVVSASLPADDRSEVGILYNDDGPDGDALPDPFVPPGAGQEIAWITGFASDATHTVKLTVDPGNRHSGVGWTGALGTPHVVLDNAGNTATAVVVWADFVTVEWLDVKGEPGRIGIQAGGSGSVTPSNGSVSSTIVVRNNVLHDVTMGVDIGDTSVIVDVYNNFMYSCDRATRIEAAQNTDPALIRVFNNSAWGCNDGFHVGPGANGRVLFRNNIAAGMTGNDFWLLGALGALSSDNLSEDATATGASPGGGGEPNRPLNGAGGINFVDFTLPTIDLHVLGTSWALDRAVDLSSAFNFDIDGGSRVLPWDIGADDRMATTAVVLSSFQAQGVNSAVELRWETASELSNLGFHLYRATAAEGPYERITAAAIPGLGSSPVGASYFHRDEGLQNGAEYFYKLEDIETTGKSTLHGPVSATPSAGVAPAPPESGSRITYGRPEENSFRIVERTANGLVVELTTEGFYAEPQEDGSVLLEIPGFDLLEGSPSVPVLRPWIDAVVGRGVALAAVRESELSEFGGLRPSGAGGGEIVATRAGAVRARRGPARAGVASRTLAPKTSARVRQVGFQGERRKAQLELAPLRWNGTTEELVLARKLTVSIGFRGRAADGRGKAPRSRSVAARLVTSRRGLHRVSYEDLFSRGRAVSADSIRLSRRGSAVPFHVEPDASRFGLGSQLYFLSEGPETNPYGDELVYELELSGGGVRMDRGSASPSGDGASSYEKTERHEENRLYQAGLVDAEDLWLWDVLLAPAVKSFPFQVVDLAPGPARLTVRLQGASDFPSESDHHVRFYANDVLEREISWNGKESLNVEFSVTTLREGENVLRIENVGDTDAPYSMVMLDFFEVVYSRETAGEGGRLEGVFPATGTASVSGLGESLLLDVTHDRPRWLSGAEVSADGTLHFATYAGRRYLAVSRSSVERPLVRAVTAAKLRKETLAADYLVIGPRAFSTEAAALLDYRRSQGLKPRFAAVEDVYSEFGFGEARPEAVREFLGYAYRYWQAPRLRYVLLLGDATYDFKDYLKTGVENQVPALMVKTSYLWTASDPTLAAVNGDDLLPDVAIGRLPASSASELRSMVAKVLAYERGEAGLGGLVVLAADNPDAAGNFPENAEEIALGELAGRNVRRLYLHQLGAAMTGEIVRAFDEGSSLLSYIGHGGIHLWADENVLDNGDVSALGSQPQQPLLLTMNCLNGYFHFPYFDSLSEELVKAEGRGAIAAFSPSGLSLNEPAHLFHRALLDEVFRRGHARLGDALLAAQARYAASGAFPELVSIYHLLGDPALRLK